MSHKEEDTCMSHEEEDTCMRTYVYTLCAPSRRYFGGKITLCAHRQGATPYEEEDTCLTLTNKMTGGACERTRLLVRASDSTGDDLFFSFAYVSVTRRAMIGRH